MESKFNFIYSKLITTEKDSAINYLTSKYNLPEYTNTFKFKKEIEKVLKQIIVGNNKDYLDKTILESEKKQLKINYYQSKEKLIKDYYNFISYIIDNFRNLNYLIDLNEVDTWNDIALIYINIDSIDYSFDFDDDNREMLIVKALNSIYLKKYNFKTENGIVKLEKDKISKVIKDIEKLIIELSGIEVINYIFLYLRNKLYSSKYKRHFLPRNYYKFGEKVEFAVPINFLINLSLKYFSSRNKKCKYPERRYKYLINLTSAFVFLYDLQDLSHINPNMFPHNYNIELVYKNILYDNLFRFNQMGGKYFFIILEGLLCTPNNEAIKLKLGFTISEYIRLVKKVITTTNINESLVLSESDFSLDEKNILDKISHSSEINKNYFFPTDFDKVENPFFLKPLIKNDDKYILIDYSYCAWGFYEVILYLLENKSIDVGINIENIIKNRVEKTGFKFHYGKYKNSDRECDLVIEETDVIIFIEIKKKAITRRSLSGDKTKIASDLIDMFMHSQEQLLSHELFIKKNNEINFENGTKLEFKNRRIEKISVSLFDNYSLNDHHFTMNLFDFLQKIQFHVKENENDDNSKEYKKMKKSIEEKNTKILNIIKGINELYNDNDIEYRKDRFNIWFLSLELILTYITEATSNNTSLSEILNKTKHMSGGTGDLYYEYNYVSTELFKEPTKDS